MEPIFNKDTRKFKNVESEKLFTENIKEKVHSMSRCTPDDKLMFV